MKHTIIIERKAKKFIESQSKDQQKRLILAINNLPMGDIKTLQATKDVFRLRVGDYRIIFKKQDDVLTITIVDVGNRGQIYKSYR